MTASVRLATGDDLEAVEAVESECFGRDRWTAQALAEAVQGKAGRAFAVAVTDDAGGEVVGCVVVRYGGDTADLERIAVVPAQRRQGAGEALLSWAVEWSRRCGAESILLEVAADNHGAIEFYEHRGFVEIDRRPRYYGGSVDALILRRPL